MGRVRIRSFVEGHGVEFADCGMHDIEHSQEWHSARTLGEVRPALIRAQPSCACVALTGLRGHVCGRACVCR